ncbi:tRNA lysidine(34) synthetase [Desulforapulum autotrophicum]|uniref:tRNA lysidine(34) synthetase n=1 Tax=Desulforapulum autotrophicum TaxID=2296 RepID=UPI00030EF48A|nr:ATP-binding protein [Desulforapulum autotrophicum]
MQGVYKKVNRSLGKAVHDYGMISPGDRIVVGVSGGMDSLTLLRMLVDLKKKAPLDFHLVPVYVDPGFEPSFAGDLKAYVEFHLGPLMVERTDHGIVAHSDENQENPCFLCSRLRRKRLFEIARDQGCNTIALGHNKDDLIETLFINMFYSGAIGTMKPCQSFFDGTLEIIRPLAYVEKRRIVSLSESLGFPAFKNPCPSDGFTKRTAVRHMLEGLYAENPHIKGNIFKAMGRVKMDYLLKQTL